MKKYLICLLTICLLILFTMPVSAAEEDEASDAVIFSIGKDFALVNGGKIACPIPIIQDGRTLVPVRFFAECMGAKVDWDQETAIVSVTNKETRILLPIGKPEITVNGEKETLDVPAQLYQNTTYIPVRAVGEIFGLTVTYRNYNDLSPLIYLSREKQNYDDAETLSIFVGLDICYIDEDIGFYRGEDGEFYYLTGKWRGNKVRTSTIWDGEKAWYQFPTTNYLFISEAGAIGTVETIYGFYPDGEVKKLYAAQMRDVVFDDAGENLYFTTLIPPIMVVEPEQRANFEGNLFKVHLTRGEAIEAEPLGVKGYAYGFNAFIDGNLDGHSELIYTEDGLITEGLRYVPDMSGWKDTVGKYKISLNGREHQKME